MSEFDIISLIHKKLKEDLSSEEEKILSDWVGGSPENQAYYKDIVSSWEGISPVLFHSEEFDADKALASAIEKLDRPAQRQAKRRRLSRLMAAAGFLLVISLSYFIYQFWNATDSLSFPSSEIVQELSLPDGSSIMLDAGSSLSFEFGKSKRIATLDGEGFFEVESDPSNPFIVMTDFGSVEVVGTKFNVREKASEETVLITVMEGRVICRNKDQTDFKTLNKGESALITPTTIESIERSSTNITSWYSGVLLFKDHPLDEVIQDMGDYFGVELILENQSLADCPFNTRMENPDLDDAFFALKEVLDLTIQSLQNNKYLLKGGSCD